MTTEELLAERGKTHGDYSVHANITQDLKRAIARPEWDKLNDEEKEALAMILHKIGRILAGNPHFEDHWRDIAGYATLVADKLVKA